MRWKGMQTATPKSTSTSARMASPVAILIVEDNAVLARTLANTIKRFGGEGKAVGTVREAIERLNDPATCQGSSSTFAFATASASVYSNGYARGTRRAKLSRSCCTRLTRIIPLSASPTISGPSSWKSPPRRPRLETSVDLRGVSITFLAAATPRKHFGSGRSYGD
jgi:hypothetical protein